MNIEIGIVGLGSSGRTTIFEALAGKGADFAKPARDGMSAHVGMTRIDDPRLKTLTDILKPKKTVPISISYTDIGASLKGMVADKGIGGKLLGELSKVDALINVVRAFEDDNIPHSEGSIDIERDITTMNLELTFSDLAIMERRFERIETSLKGATATDRVAILREKTLLEKIKVNLEKDIPIREMTLSPEEIKALSSYQFLTAKPILMVVNIGEEQLDEVSTLEEKLNAKYQRPHCRVVAICGKLEKELAELDDETAESWRTEFGLTEPGVDRVIRSSYELLDLISFFTIASSEVKAWPVRNGTEAVKAAGKIHTDMERGFIRAEVIHFNNLEKCNDLQDARKRGLLRVEGKTYIVKDGDVITFLFNV